MVDQMGESGLEEKRRPRYAENLQKKPCGKPEIPNVGNQAN